ncbi:hypothetical protein G7085_18505 [Tessaracoccus sp. HDW20]|nr:hypothetical protein [Tessaracoccus coleopterorum]
MRAKHAFSQVLRRSAVAGSWSIRPATSRISPTSWRWRGEASASRSGGEARLNPIHGADLAAFIAERVTGPAGSWDVGGPDVFTYRELEELMFRIAGRRPRVLRIGPGVTRRCSGWRTGVTARGQPGAVLPRVARRRGRRDPTGERRLETYLRSLP